MKTSHRILAMLAALLSASAFAAEKTGPLKALLVTGGCCHDYPAQKTIIPQGISARANVEWTVVIEGDDREHKVSIYNNPDWSKGYDVVVHNECYGFVKDVAFVERITAPHKAGLPAVFLHCSNHSYRMAETDEWRASIGIKSMSHEKRRDLTVISLGTKHPVIIGFPNVWPNPEDECYKNEIVWPTVTPRATAYGEETKKDHVVIWVNTYGKARTFTTSLGHTNATMQSPVYLDLVARGLLWTCDKLNENGTPKPGYGPGGK
jgi:type 1 glutamine amidotransferase